MAQQIFPKDIIENSQEANFSRHSVRSRVMYSIIVAFLIGLVCLLPFIKVDVGIRSQGIIRPVTDLISLSSPVSGSILTLNRDENSFIRKGEIFAVLEAPQLAEKIRFNEVRRQQLNTFLEDLILLQRMDSTELITTGELRSARYQSSYLEFRQQLLNQQHEINRLRRNLDRETALYNKSIISEAAFNDFKFSYQSSVRQYKLLVEQQQNKWKLEEITIQEELDQLISAYAQLQQDLNRYEIRAPITGTVQNVAGIFRNSFVYPNQVLAEISPDTSLVAETFISPRDIGLLQDRLPVRINIDAYNYNQWGFVTGKIENISTDVFWIDNRPLYRVHCSLDSTWLELPSGLRREIKKGMTFQARFIVNRRSLFQLLYDKVDDWLNPALGRNDFTVQTVNP